MLVKAHGSLEAWALGMIWDSMVTIKKNMKEYPINYLMFLQNLSVWLLMNHTKTIA